MRIAISGASGFVGSALVEALMAEGHEICVLQRPGSGHRHTTSGIRVTAWEPKSGLADPQALADCEALFHLAGKSIASGRWSEQVKQEIRTSRVDATRRLAEQLSETSEGPKTIISASAVGIYGDRGETIVDEDASCGDDFLALVARDWEQACEPLRQAGLRVIHPRLGIVLGQGGGALQKILPLFKYRLGGRVGAGSQFWSWVSLQDCIAALMWLLQQPTAAGPYNVVAPNPVTNTQFTEQLAEALGKPALLPVPAFALKIAMGELADALLLASCRAVPSRLLQQGFDFRDPELLPFFQRELGA